MNLAQIKERLAYYRSILQKRWKILLLTGALLSLLMGVWSFLKPITYTSEATFHPDSGESSSLNAFADPISFILGGGRGSRRAGAEAVQMLEVLRSRHLSELVAGDTIIFQGKKQLLADVVLAELSKLFGPYQIMNGLKSIIIKQEPLTLEQKKIGVGRMLKNNLDISINDNGFLEMEMIFYNIELLEIISEKYIEKLSYYYHSQQTEKSKTNLAFYTHRADSVEKEINKVNQQLARYVDQSSFAVSAQTQIKRKELEYRLEFLVEMFKPLILSKEQAVSQLQKDTPIIQVLDHPKPPYLADKPSLILHLIAGFLLGTIMLSLFFLRKPLSKDIAHLIKESLKDEPEEDG